MINEQKTALLTGAVRLYNEQKRFGCVRDIESDIFSRPPPNRAGGESETRLIARERLSMTVRLMRQFNSMSLREKNKVRRLQVQLGRPDKAIKKMGEYYGAFFSPEAQKLRGFIPGVKLLIKRVPLTVVQILTVEKRPDHARTVQHYNVQFSSGITGALYVVSGHESFNNKEALHVKELINLNDPTIEDILWCDRSGVNIQELLHPKA
jgi:hypothetical protein